MSACGDSSEDCVSEDTNNTQYKTINNSTDAIEAKATLVPEQSKVKKSSEDTVLRVWHFQNSQEAICVVTGSAKVLTSK